MQEKFVILCCENIRPEVDAVLATGDLPLATARSFPFHCGHVRSFWDTVRDQYLELEAAGAKVCLCGCGCVNTVDIPKEVLARPTLVFLEAGASLFLPENLAESHQTWGYYIKLPGRLLKWKENAHCNKLNQETAREMFRESSKEIILLDTGVRAGLDPVLAEFAEFTGLPARKIPVGIDHFRLLLRKQYLEWQCEEERAACRASVSAAEKRVADYSMVADLTGKIIGIHDEQTIIRQTLELVTLLTSPKRAGFLSVHENTDGAIISTPPDAYMSPEHFQRISGVHPYSISGNGDSFLFRISYHNDPLGILSVDEVSIPESLSEYINLAHFISQIAGLAIMIARTHQDLEQTITERDDEITERKMIQAELSLHSEILQNMAEGVALIRASDGTIVFVNSRFNEMFGYRTGGLVGQNVSVLNAPDSRQAGEIAQEIIRELETSGVWTGEIKNIRKDRSEFWSHAIVSTYVHPIFGKVWITVHEDITEKKLIETALAGTEQRYRQLYEGMRDAFASVDLEGRITGFNPAFSQLIGYEPDEIYSLSFQDITPDRWHAMEDEILHRDVLKNGYSGIYEKEYRRKDGTICPIELRVNLIAGEDGAPQGMWAIIRDISERKKAEEALMAALKKLNMLSSITRHDILNQVMGLRTFLELSKEDLKGTKYEGFIEKEDKAAEAIQRQIEFTKYYQDIGVNAPRWQDPGEVIREAIGQLNLPSVNVQVMVPEREIFADPLIVKVFFNLMENSLRHGERVTAMSFSARESGAGLVITYEDNGVGISAGDKPKLFQKGFGKHTGLGLFLSREILAITGITIAETGVPGSGARFEITVPAGAWRPKVPS